MKAKNGLPIFEQLALGFYALLEEPKEATSWLVRCRRISKAFKRQVVEEFLSGSVTSRLNTNCQSFSDFYRQIQEKGDIIFYRRGDKILIDHNKEYTGPTPVLLLEIDENPDNHPMRNSSSNNPSQSSLGKTLTFELWTDQQYLYRKLEGWLSRAEFNYTAARGSFSCGDYTFGDVVSVNGITGVNYGGRWYYFDHDVIEDPFSEGYYCALTVWEDDPGGESPWEYYPADPYWESEADFEHGYLDDPSHNSPDDLYGYIFIGATDGVPTTYGAMGYRSSAGGNHAYPDNPQLNAMMRINLP